MATFVDSAAAVEVSKPETVEMEVSKDVEEDAAKGLKRKLEDAVADDAVKTNGTAAVEEGKNGHGEAKNGTNGNHVEVKDSPVKKAKTEETPDVATEKVEEKEAVAVEKESTEKSEEKVEETKTETPLEPVVDAEVPAAVVESTEEKESKTEETAVTTTESSSNETEPEKVAAVETAEAEAVAVVDEKKEEPTAADAEAPVAPAADPVSTDPEEKAAE